MKYTVWMTEWRGSKAEEKNYLETNFKIYLVLIEFPWPSNTKIDVNVYLEI